MKYELTVVLPGKTTPAKKKSVTEKISKLITAQKGKVDGVDDWGEKELSYQIAKNNSGVFLHYQLELAKDSATGVDSKLNLEEDIIRYLLVRKE